MDDGVTGKSMLESTDKICDGAVAGKLVLYGTDQICDAVAGKLVLEGTLAERVDQLDKRETELLEETTRQTATVSKLRDEVARLRTKCDEKEFVLFTLPVCTFSFRIKILPHK